MAENGKSRQLIAKVQAVTGTYVAPAYDTDQNVEVYNLDDGTACFSTIVTSSFAKRTWSNASPVYTG